jgi:hypothetical protein
MKLFNVRGLLTGALFACVIPATASINLIQNGNFLTGGNLSSPGSYTGIGYNSGSACGSTCTIADWNLTSGNVDWIGTYWSAPTANGGYPGGYSVDLDGFQAAGTISQTVNTTAGQVYTLNFYLGANPDGPPDPKNLLVSATDATPGSASFQPVFPPSIESGGLAAWTLEAFTFTANGSTSTISFASTDTPAEVAGNADGVSFGPVVAGVSLVAPEPGFYGIVGFGLAGLAFFMRRRRSA